MKDVIALCGLAGSGKGTVGDILVNEYGYKKLSFADSLKDAVSSIFGWDRLLLEGDTEESRLFRETINEFWSDKFGKDVTPRIILQQFGTFVCRDNFLDSIWINSLEKKLSKYDKIVLCDVRFNNEISFLNTVNAKFIEIDRPENTPEWVEIIKYNNQKIKYFNKYTYMSLYHPEIHKSEYEWIGNKYIDNLIVNDGSFSDLEEKIKRFL
jgi:adenylate kinase family enzyme